MISAIKPLLRRFGTIAITIVLAALMLGFSFWVGGMLSDNPSPEASPEPDNNRRAKLASMGKLVYQIHCLRCHGIEGHGNGPDAAALKPPPRDFGSSQWRFEPTFDSIQRVTTQGILDTAMTAFGRVLSPVEIDAVSEHVSGFAPTRLSTLTPLIKATGMRPASAGEFAPTFEMAYLDGVKKALKDYEGKVVVMTFWAPSCAPCLAKMLDLERFAETHQDGLVVLPVCIGESDPKVVANAVSGRLTRLAPLIDGGMGAVLFDVQATPTTVLIDRDGRILARIEGALDWTGVPFNDLIRQALQPGPVRSAESPRTGSSN